MTQDLTRASAAELSGLYAARKASPVEVLEAVLDRAAAAAARTAAAADKKAEKEARQNAQLFLKAATPFFSNGGLGWV